MNELAQAIAQKAQDQEIIIAAAKLQTGPLIRKGWTAIFIGWLLPAIPVIGLIGFPIAFCGGGLAGIIAASRGNTSGGVILILAAWAGTLVVGVLWVFIYMLFGASLASVM